MSNNRHDIKYTDRVAILWLPLLFIFSHVTDVNWLLMYLSYFVFQAIGIGLGLHRVVCHGLKLKFGLHYVAAFVGMMTHSGGIKNSALSHYQHHSFTDQANDADKKFGIKANLASLTLYNKRQVISRFNDDKVYKYLDDNYYPVVIAAYTVLFAMFGFDAMYFIIPASFATFIHNYIAVKWFHKYGYENYKTSDSSKNSWYFFPLMFGENWHNNHHGSFKVSTRVRWWEIDLIDIICKPFYVTK